MTTASTQIRHHLACELVTEIAVLDNKLKESEKQLRKAVLATGSGLLSLYGIGPVTAARLLADVTDIARFLNPCVAPVCVPPGSYDEAPSPCCQLPMCVAAFVAMSRA